jgi:hypothetical protein
MVVTAVGVWAEVGAHASNDAAARLVVQMRTATETTDFTGEVEVRWRNAAGRVERSTVEVTSTSGVLEIASGGPLVLDEAGHTFLKDRVGWSSPVGEPTPGHAPSPDARWALTVRPGTSHDRAVTTVVATRANGTVAQRMVIDDETHLLLGRQVLDDRGVVQRAFEFESLQLAPVAARAVPVLPDTTTRTAKALADVPAGYRAPESAGSGYVLVSRSQHDNGINLVYSDGLFSVSVLEQRGDLDWGALPSGGTTTEVDGARARRYSEPMGDVLVWERDGVVFTCVSDAPSDVFHSMLTGIVPDRSLPAQVADFVFGPFGFE